MVIQSILLVAIVNVTLVLFVSIQERTVRLADIKVSAKIASEFVNYVPVIARVVWGVICYKARNLCVFSFFPFYS